MSKQNNTKTGAATTWRDEEKDEKKEIQSLERLLGITDAMLGTLLKDPRLWMTPNYKSVVDKITEIARNPVVYPPSPTSWGVERSKLTKGISDELTKRRMDLPNENKLCIQITHAEKKERTDPIGLNEQSTNIGTRQRWLFTAVDGDGNTFLLRIDSTLNHAGMTLTPGTIAEVTSSFPVYFNHEDTNDNRCAVVVRKFDIVGRQPVPDDLLSGGNNNKSAIKAEKKKGPKKRKKPAADTTATTQPSKPTCDGCLCSKHGVAFDLCLSKIIPPATVPLPIVARDCVFADLDVKDMSNSNKRFLLYYYYATTVYQFHGSGNRIDLPECIIYAVRDLYKEENIVDVTNVDA